MMDFDPKSVDGLRLADAIDQRASILWDELVNKMGKLHISKGITSYPPIPDARKAVGRLNWLVFSQSEVRWDDFVLDGTYCDFLCGMRNEVLAVAAYPIFQSLSQGSILATGIPEPEKDHGFKFEAIPCGRFAVGRSVIIHNGSRIEFFDRNGILDQAYNAVKLAVISQADVTLSATPSPEPIGQHSAPGPNPGESQRSAADIERRAKKIANAYIKDNQYYHGVGQKLVDHIKTFTEFSNRDDSGIRKMIQQELSEWNKRK